MPRLKSKVFLKEGSVPSTNPPMEVAITGTPITQDSVKDKLKASAKVG